MADKLTMRVETRFVPVESDPIEMTPEQEAAVSRLLQKRLTQTLYTLEERLLYGRAVSNVTVIDGQVVTRPALPEGPR